MDPLIYQSKFEVMQYPCALAARPAFYGPIVYNKKNLTPCIDETRRLHELKFYLESEWVHMDDIWDI